MIDLIHRSSAKKVPVCRGVLVFAVGLLLSFGTLVTSPIEAKNLPHNPLFNHSSNNEPLQSVLKSFAAQLGMPVIISKNVEGKVNGKFSDRPTSLLNKLASVYSLVWYYDGSTLYIYNDNEIKSEVLKVRHISVNELRRDLLRLGILDSKSKWQSLPRQEVAYVSGPPRFVELAVELTQVLDSKASQSISSKYSVELFPLKYALANDREIQVRGKSIIIKGVASILKSILGRSVPTEVSSKDKEGKDTSRTAMSPSALVEANDRLNAIIISDKKSNMAMYSDLIDKLDQPSNQVEINVSIIEVSTEKLSRLGLDMETKGSDGSASFGSPASPISGGGAATGLPAQTVIIGKAGEFLGRINMLSKEGNAKILSRPSILTIDKVEAIIDNSSTFHVRVAGKEDVELFPVTVGSMVKVTPRIVDESDGRWIHMNIDIEDGTQDDGESVDNIPIVKKSTISTSAVVAEDSSLLIGGYYYDRQGSTESKVPFLGDIPVLSFFFNWQSDDSRRVARLFLITPRILGYKEKGNNAVAADILTSFQKLKPDQMPMFSDKKGLTGEPDNEE